MDDLTLLLISGNFDQISHLSIQYGYAQIVGDLKALKNSLSHDKENQYNRQLIIKAAHAINFLSNKQKTSVDHKNHTLEIKEDNVFKVYETACKDFIDNAENTKTLIKSSNTSNRYLYQTSKVSTLKLIKEFKSKGISGNIHISYYLFQSLFKHY